MAIDNSYLSAIVYSDGETGNVFPIFWDRVDDSHVQVYFDGGLLTQGVDYTSDSYGINLITYTLGPTNELIITRFTPRDNRRIDWSTGAPFVTAALDAEGINNHYIRQELFDWIRLFDNTTVGATGPQGPRGIQGPEGPEGPQGIEGARGIQGIQGVEGPQGQVGPQGIDGPTGPIGPHGIQGVQGVQGNAGADGTSFTIDAYGTLLERNNYDNELDGFSYYATDYSVQADQLARFMRTTGDGLTTDYLLPFTPDGQQSISVGVGGVIQTPDTYTILVVGDNYTVQFNNAPDDGVDITVREFTISTGYGAIFLKASDIAGHWSEAIPFGKGPRGDQGIQGVDGVQGPVGEQGERGIQGVQGAQGIDGQQGIQGPDGVRGPIGEQGAVGPRGAQGYAGAAGANGINGLDGAQGPKGDKGDQGDKGPVGDKGANGTNGTDGADGSRGADGTDGADGRSSSGKKYTTTGNAISYGSPVEFDRGTVAVSKPFIRSIRATSIYVKLASASVGSAVAECRMKIVYQGVSYYGPLMQSQDTSTGYLPSPIIHVPANSTGTFIVYIETYGSIADWVQAGPQDWIMEILPESTELS